MQTYNPNQGNGNNRSQNDQYQQYNGQPNNQYQQFDGQYQNNQYGGQYNNQYQQYDGQYQNNQYQQYDGQYQNNQYQQPYGDQYNAYGNTYQAGYDQGYAGMSGMGVNNSVMTAAQQSLRETISQEVVSKSFLFMLVALLITAVASLTTSPRTAIAMLQGDTYMFLLFGEIAIVLVSNWAIHKNKPILAGVLFAVYSYLTGILFSVLFMVFTTASIVAVCLVTAVLFGVMAVIGLTTKKDLSTAGSILIMALLGIILMSTVNLVFFRSSMADTVICCFGVLIFVGLTAYDAQKIKKMAMYSNDNNVLSLAMLGAFELYLDFINLFLKLLRLMGKRK
ncbi:MAG: Bax inhibitor-1 family protein [Lachnospiraceae bacterium]|nr:Bax inhibitor-1 family protein [Lachnospiraceae bacterium]